MLVKKSCYLGVALLFELLKLINSIMYWRLVSFIILQLTLFYKSIKPLKAVCYSDYTTFVGLFAFDWITLTHSLAHCFRWTQCNPETLWQSLGIRGSKEMANAFEYRCSFLHRLNKTSGVKCSLLSPPSHQNKHAHTHIQITFDSEHILCILSRDLVLVTSV